MDPPRSLKKKKQKEKVGEAQSTPTEAIRETSKRAPLTDLSNTSPSSLPSSQSSSPSLTDSISKYSFSWARKSHADDKPIANDSSNSNPKFTTVESSSNNQKKKEKEKVKEKETGKGQGNKENSSSMPSPLPKTPSVSGNAEAFELPTVYTRRHAHTAKNRKRKGKEIAEPLSCLHGIKMPDLREKKDKDGNAGLSKSCLLPRKRKQQRVKTEVNASKDDLPRDFVDKQRAYFAEVDAFELEEEVKSSDESE